MFNNACFSAKRAGDFHMFNYDPHTEDVSTFEEHYVPEVTKGAGVSDKLDPAQVRDI